MQIERIQVEEGFLSGLDLEFETGLNVLIGPRGSGKTSIIELIRFCLGVGAVSDEHERTAREHAQSVLGSGEVTVTLRLPDRRVRVTRTADENEPRKSNEYPKPLIYSQNEIEAVGLEPDGRLGVIDGFIDTSSNYEENKHGLVSRIQSLTVEIDNLSRDIEKISDQIRELEDVSEALKEARQKKVEFADSLEDRQDEQEQLEEYSDHLATLSVREDLFERSRDELQEWRDRLQQIIDAAPTIPDWPDSAGNPDLLKPIRSQVTQITGQVKKALEQLDKSVNIIDELEEDNQEDRLRLEKKSRKLRSTLEELKEGAGEAERRISELKERASQLEALKQRQSDIEDKLSQTHERRAQAISELQDWRDKRFEHRQQVASRLNDELGPEIRVRLEKGGYSPGYTSAIISALRGSGLHYNTLAPEMAESISPRELAELVEEGSADKLADLVDIGQDRAQRVVAEIASAGTEDILTAPVEDSVELSLLDGNEYKPTPNLSTGQRCTVILSILLGYEDTSLIVDQPEDHLDNAFVVETLIDAIRQTKSSTQLIFATHNANIPVLGDAELVASLGSDGKRGFVDHVGSLDEKRTVEAITSVMEGGHEAFRRRAQFYDERLADSAG